jgi:hypothetical protein
MAVMAIPLVTPRRKQRSPALRSAPFQQSVPTSIA